MVFASEIEQAVDKAYRTLLARHPACAGAVRKYSQTGGRGSWVTFGLLSNVSNDDRLVLESLYLERHKGCVVRVYNEHPLKFHYARKNKESIEACAALIAEALEAFQIHLPRKLLDTKAFDPPPELAHIEQALMPVPPPLGACEVPD